MSWTHGYTNIPSLPKASATHLLVITAAIKGTMYSSPPVNSNIITTKDTGIDINATLFY